MVAVTIVRRACEVRVDEGLFCRNPSRGIVYEQCVQQIETYVIKASDDGGDVRPVPLWERRLEVRERSDAGPVLFARRAKDARTLLASVDQAIVFYMPKDFEDLVDLGIPGEKGLAGAHFRKDAAHRPHVHAG
jgi:hypothetical protein